ncbi:MAG TPA: class I SAM-dependent methyltransferase [Stellaceae bacterium]
MSALDLLIRRLMSQRSSLERASVLATRLPGPALQIGWGDGIAYDHLREVLRRRELFVFDRTIAAPDSAPPDAEHRILGDPAETLPQAWERWRREAAIAYLNFPAPARAAAELAPLVAPLLRPGAVVIAEATLELPGWEAIPAPEGARDAQEHLYRVGG